MLTFSTFLFSIALQFLSIAVRQEKAIKFIQTAIEIVKLTVAGNMIIYVENLKDTTKKTIKIYH